MRSNVVGLATAAALLASVSIANAESQVKLTDGQLDNITAGASPTSAYVAGRSDANIVINSGAVAMINSMGGQGILQASQNTGANAVQQQSVTLSSTFSP